MTVIGAGQVAIPDSASEQENVIVTGVLVLMPFAFGVGETVYEIVGGVLSMLIGALVIGVWFPATSVAVPLTV